MAINFYLMLEASFFSTFRIIFISFCGFLLVRFKIIDKQIMKGIAEMTANFLIPCLSVSEICKSFNVNNISMWIPLVIYCLLNVFLGFIIGLNICIITRPRTAEIRRLILVSCMFSNSTSMQLIYVDSLGGLLGKMINVSESEAKSRGYVIVLIYTIFVNFLRWSIGYNLMKPDTNYFSIELSSSSTEEAVQVMDTTGKKVIQTRRADEYRNTIVKIIKEGMNMPFIAGIFAIVVSTIPVVNTFFSDKKSIGYRLFVESCDAVGRCVSTFVILILGLNLSLSLPEKEENEEKINPKILLSILITKALIFPTIGLVFVYQIGYNFGFLTDKLQTFLLLTNFCTPTAINLITIAIINKFQINNLSKLLVYQYVMGALTVTLWTAIYLNLLS